MTLTWPNDWASQKSEITSLLGRIETVDRQISPATWVNTEAPTEDDVDSAWSAKKGLGTSAGQNSKTHWYNPDTGRIENIYIQLSDIAPKPTPLMVSGRSENMRLIETKYFDDDSLTTYDFVPDDDYITIRIIGQFRSTFAGTSAQLLLRPNNISTTTYKVEILRALGFGGGMANVSSTTSTALTSTHINVPAATVPYRNMYSTFILDFDYVYNLAMCNGKIMTMYDNSADANEVRVQHLSAAENNSPMTSLRFVHNNGNIAKGSWFSAYGITPASI